MTTKVNITEKYSLKMRFNQFRRKVPENYFDEHEIVMIEKFEEHCLNLKSENKSQYTMVELGSNQAYYSCLFQAILGTDKAKNIMVEPFINHLEIGKEHFRINGFEGTFVHGSVGQNWRKGDGRGDAPEARTITLEELFNEQNLEELDMLHCDIDGSEEDLLKETDFLSQKKINCIFLLAHGTKENNNIQFCKDELFKCGYNLVFESEIAQVGSDTLLIFTN